MFEHLDDPAPPSFDRTAVRQRVAALRRRRHRGLWASAGSVMTAAAVIAVVAAVDSRGPTRVTTGPAASTPLCAAPTDQNSTVTVYNSPTLSVGWLPAGYHRVSGSPNPPNNSDPLTYEGAHGMSGTVQVVFDVGITAQQLLPAGIGVKASTVDIGGNSADVYTVPSQAGVTVLRWTPGFEVAIEVRGTNVSTSALEQVARSITTELGPPTAITSTSYLGTVIPYRSVTSSTTVRAAFPQLFATGRLAGKLATYAEVRAAIGAAEIGGTDAPDGLPVWLLYNQTGTHSATPAWYALINALTGQPVEGGSENLANGIPAPASIAWIAQVPDHQHIQPCIATAPTDVEPAVLYAVATNSSPGGQPSNSVVAISPATGAVLRTVTERWPTASTSPPAVWAIDSLKLDADQSRLYMAAAASGMCANNLATVAATGGPVELIDSPPAGYEITGLALSRDSTAIATTHTPCAAAANPTGSKTTTTITNLQTGATTTLPIPSADGAVTDWGGPHDDQLLFRGTTGDIKIVVLRSDRTIGSIRTLPPPNPPCQLLSPTFVGHTSLVAAIEDCQHGVPGSSGDQLVELDTTTGAPVRTIVTLQPNLTIIGFAIDAEGSWIACQTDQVSQPPDTKIHILHAGATTTIATPTRVFSLTW